MQQSAIDAIGDDLQSTVASLETWSAACIAAA